MNKLIILATCFFLITSAAIAQEKVVETKDKTASEIKKESTENVEKVKEKSNEQVKEISGEKNEDLEKKEEKTQTLITENKRKKIDFSGYFAPVFRFSQVDTTKYTTFIGYKGGFMIEGFVIGGSLFVNADYKKRNIKDKNRNIYMGYTGLLLEYNFLRKKIVNFSLGTTVGIGTAGYFKTVRDEYGDDYRYIGARFFVLEPEVVMYINVTRFFRMGLGGSYRYINGLKQYNLDDDSYSGFAGSLIFQFGWF